MMRTGEKDAQIPPAALEEQERVNAYFQSTAEFWAGLYRRKDLRGVLYQQRRDLVLGLVDQLGLAPGSRVLDAGCGPGLITLALARRGYQVDAMDATQAMIDATRQLAAESGIEHRVTAKVGDVHKLPYPDRAFSLVMLIGVADWLETLAVPMREIARVLQPGGYLIANGDNSWALHHVLDPANNPLSAPLKRLIRKSLHLVTGRQPRAHGRLRSLREFESSILTAGLERIARRPLGFGPFSFFRWKFLPASVGFKINDHLQRLADRNVPVLRSAAYTYIVVAQKPQNTARG